MTVPETFEFQLYAKGKRCTLTVPNGMDRDQLAMFSKQVTDALEVVEWLLELRERELKPEVTE